MKPKLLILLFVCLLGQARSSAAQPNVTVLREQGGRVDFSPDGSLIAFDAEGDDHYTDVYTMDADGTNEQCLTCDHADIPDLHNGNPVWHPDGEYIAFQSQDPRHPGLPIIGSLYTSPGSGINNDLAVIKRDGTRYQRLTKVGKGGGVLHPQFSHDGKKIIWAERISDRSPGLGQWALKMADFVVSEDGPAIENIQEFQPGGFQMYETHGFSPDDRQILFTACRDKDFFNSDIYLYDLVTRLTEPSEKNWDEHAHFLPGGEHILWMSSSGIRQKKFAVAPRTDYWIMRKDGTEKKRLTRFNEDKSSAFYRKTAADWSADPTGGRIVAYLINGEGKEYRNRGPGPIVFIELDQ